MDEPLDDAEPSSIERASSPSVDDETSSTSSSPRSRSTSASSSLSTTPTTSSSNPSFSTMVHEPQQRETPVRRRKRRSRIGNPTPSRKTLLQLMMHESGPDLVQNIRQTILLGLGSVTAVDGVSPQHQRYLDSRSFIHSFVRSRSINVCRRASRRYMKRVRSIIDSRPISFESSSNTRPISHSLTRYHSLQSMHPSIYWSTT